MNLSFAHAQEVRQFETVRPLSLNISRSKRTSPGAFSFMSVATEGYTELGLSFPICGSRSRGLSARVRAIARGYWLRETVLQARLANWADVSDAALLKRLRNSGEWLHCATSCFGRTAFLGSKALGVAELMKRKVTFQSK
jgi:hypothetical protein